MRVKIAEHDRFVRNGSDLYADLHVPMTQAALGAEINFESLDGPVPVTIKSGAQTGERFQLKGNGITKIRGGRGDLILTLIVDTPTNLTSDQEEALRQMAKDREEEVSDPESSIMDHIRSKFS